MTYASGVGSMPGGAVGEEQDNARAYAEATRIVLGEVDLPHVPELPGRGAVANLTGRTLGLVVDLGADLQPAGWRLTDAAGIDQRRARSLLAQDLDTVEEQAQGITGPLKVQVAGPWTLAATVERPRGDRLLADHGPGTFISLAQLVADAEIFGFEWEGFFWLPMFQFAMSDLAIEAAPRQVRAELGEEFDGWALSAWFVEPNMWLANRRPIDLIGPHLEAVLQAARADRFVATG